MECTDVLIRRFCTKWQYYTWEYKVEVGHLSAKEDDYDFTSLPLHYHLYSTSEGNNKDEVDNNSTGNGV